jgi:hypothetical protein
MIPPVPVPMPCSGTAVATRWVAWFHFRDFYTSLYRIRLPNRIEDFAALRDVDLQCIIETMGTGVGWFNNLFGVIPSVAQVYLETCLFSDSFNPLLDCRHIFSQATLSIPNRSWLPLLLKLQTK